MLNYQKIPNHKTQITNKSQIPICNDQNIGNTDCIHFDFSRIDEKIFSNSSRSNSDFEFEISVIGICLIFDACYL
jgi:hypothetical protein